jgi:Lipocalin-like domain
VNRRSILAILATTASGLAVFVGDAMAQGKKIDPEQLIGTWTLVSADNLLPDRSRAPAFGANPRGFLVFAANGYFSISLVNSGLPKFTSNTRDKGTVDENKAAVAGSLFYFGTYSVSADGTLATHIEGSSFLNAMGTDQKRTITVLSATGVTWINTAASAGGTAELAWKRIK